MTKTLPSRRLLLVANPEIGAQLCDLLDEGFEPMECLEANSIAQARFMHQHNPADLVLIHHDLVRREGQSGLTWLTWRRDVPLIYLADDEPRNWQQALLAGVNHCVPYSLVVQEPGVLLAALRQALDMGKREVEMARLGLQLRESRQHVERLIGMLWRSSPAAAERPWHTQRTLLDRLQEELSRADRHQLPLTVVLGQVQSPALDLASLPDWTVNVIVQGKRRSDVVGQYGANGFMLLLMHTPDRGGQECCRRLRHEISQAHQQLGGPHRPLQTYFGMASATTEHLSVAGLLRQAEENLEMSRMETLEQAS
jgi:PleD family two-component response regulator